MKTFEEYNNQIAFTVSQNNGHCDPLWALLECLGEAGEVLNELMDQQDDEISAVAIGDVLKTELATCYSSLVKLEKLKKKFRRDQVKPLDLLFDTPSPTTPTPELLKELGGMLWGLNQLCNQCGTSLGEVAEVNYRELRARFDGDSDWLLTKGAE